MNSVDIKLSKSLSWLLRHGAEKEGLTFDEGGFIDVDRILRLKQFRNYCEADIKKVAELNDKKRFALRLKNGNTGQLQIRANQGHSLPLDEEGLLEPLTFQTAPTRIYHGTYFKCLPSIESEGLKRMGRNHVHFTKKLPGDASVVSGIRKNSEVIVTIDTLKAMSDGFKFYESENEVILCPGNEQGILPASYIVDIKPSKLMN